MDRHSLTRLVRWLRSPARPGGSSPRLGVEPLEDRLTPAANYWKPTVLAPANNYLWSEAQNWSLGHTPTATDDLHFAALTATAGYRSVDDIPQVTVNSINFDGIGAGSSAYVIAASAAGNLITLASSNAATFGITIRTKASLLPSDSAVLNARIDAGVKFAATGTITTGDAGLIDKQTNAAAVTDSLTFTNTVDNGGADLTVTGVGAVAFNGLDPASYPNPPAALTGAGGLIVADTSLASYSQTAGGVTTLVVPGPKLKVTVGTDGSGIGGATTVKQGTLILSAGDATRNGNPATTALGVPHQLVVGTGESAAAGSKAGKGAFVRLAYGNEIADSSPVRVNSDGTLNLNNANDRVGRVTLSGGTVTTGTGTLILGDDLYAVTSDHQATMTGKLDLGGGTDHGDGAGKTTVINVSYNADPEILNPKYIDASSHPDVELDIQAVVSSAGGVAKLVKQGAGILQLDAANTSTAGSDVRAGTLWVSNGKALQFSKATVAANASVFAVNPAAASVTFTCPLLTLNGTGDSKLAGGGALRAAAWVPHGVVNWDGPVALASDSRVWVDSATTLDITGVVGDGPTAGAGLAKSGSGTFILDADNTYTGPTTINTVLLLANHVTSLGKANAGGVTVNGTASLLLAGGKTFAPKVLVLNGTGGSSTTGGFSALQGLGVDALGLVTQGTNTWTGTVAIHNTAQIGATRGNTLQIGNATNRDDPTNGVISGDGALQIGRVTTAAYSFEDGGVQTLNPPLDSASHVISAALGYDTGTVKLCGSNTYTGTTTVQAGVLTAANSHALGADVAGTSVRMNTSLKVQSALDGSAVVIGEPLSLTGRGVYTGPGGVWGYTHAALWNVAGSNTWAGPITLQTAVSATAATGTTGDTIGAAAVSGVPTRLTITGNVATRNSQAGELDKTGPGTVVLAGDNSGYNGQTFITDGTAVAASNTAFGKSLNTNKTTVVAGATLALDGVAVNGGLLSLGGGGYNGQGALWAKGGANSWSGGGGVKGITATASAMLNTADGASLVLRSNVYLNSGTTLTVGGAGAVELNDSVAGLGGVTVAMGTGGRTVFNPTGGGNRYSGLTQVKGGTLQLRGGSVQAIGNSAVTVTGGTLAVAAEGAIIGGTLDNQATVSLSGVLTVLGNYQGAVSTSKLAYHQTKVGTLVVESDGTTVGQLRVAGTNTTAPQTGNVTLDAGAKLTIKGTVPVGKSLSVLTWSSTGAKEAGNFTLADSTGFDSPKFGTDPLTGLPSINVMRVS